MSDDPERSTERTSDHPPMRPESGQAIDASIWAMKTLGPPRGEGLLGSIDAYDVVEKLGEGGMGIVYRARDPQSGKDVAIKMLRPELASDNDRVRDFDREVRQMQKLGELNHPHLVNITRYVNREPMPYFVMPYYPQGSLARRLRQGPLTEGDALRFGIQIAEALGVIHGIGSIHRDVSPHNVLIDEQGNARLADFGLVRVLHGPDASIIPVGAANPRWAVGKPAYMAPEIVSGEETGDGRVDIYSLGAVLYEMFSGQRPYDGASTKEIIDQIRQRPSRPLREVVPQLRPDVITVVEGAMARELPDRYASMRYLLEDLRRLERGETPAGPKGGRSNAGVGPVPPAVPPPVPPPVPPIPAAAPRGGPARPHPVPAPMPKPRRKSMAGPLMSVGCLTALLVGVAAVAGVGYVYRDDLSRLIGRGAVTPNDGPPTTIPVPENERQVDELAAQLEEKLRIGDLGGARAIVQTLAAYDTRIVAPDRFHLLTAVRHDRREVVAEILRLAPAAVAVTETDGSTALHVAAREGHAELIKMLIRTGRMSPDVKNSTDARPLHVAARANRREAITALADLKADLNATDLAGDTPLHVAAQWGTPETFDLLAARGANAALKNSRGQTPLRPK